MKLGEALLSKPWFEHDQEIWIASSLILKRNIEKFAFPGKLDAEQRKQIVSLLTKGIADNTTLKSPTFLTSEEATPTQKEFLYEHFLSGQSFQQAHSGEAFAWDTDGQFVAYLNLQDHLQLQFIEISEKLEERWNQLVELETALSQSVGFAFHPKFGFLTANPMECGSAVKMATFLQVPALLQSNQLDETIAELGSQKIEFTGMQGDPDQRIGHVIRLSNRYTLGVAEEDIMSSLQRATTKLLLAEKSARSNLKAEPDPTTKDQVHRAFGLLTHSLQLEPVEALDALSLLKLGLDVGWVTGTDPTTLNKLFFQCRRGHLLYCIGQEDADMEGIEQKRAEFIKNHLKNISLIDE